MPQIIDLLPGAYRERIRWERLVFRKLDWKFEWPKIPSVQPMHKVTSERICICFELPLNLAIEKPRSSSCCWKTSVENQESKQYTPCNPMVDIGPLVLPLACIRSSDFRSLPKTWARSKASAKTSYAKGKIWWIKSWFSKLNWSHAWWLVLISQHLYMKVASELLLLCLKWWMVCE